MSGKPNTLCKTWWFIAISLLISCMERKIFAWEEREEGKEGEPSHFYRLIKLSFSSNQGFIYIYIFLLLSLVSFRVSSTSNFSPFNLSCQTCRCHSHVNLREQNLRWRKLKWDEEVGTSFLSICSWPVLKWSSERVTLSVSLTGLKAFPRRQRSRSMQNTHKVLIWEKKYMIWPGGSRPLHAYHPPYPSFPLQLLLPQSLCWSRDSMHDS